MTDFRKIALLCAYISASLPAAEAWFNLTEHRQQINDVWKSLKNPVQPRSLYDDAAVPESAITWNPQLIRDKPLLTQLCANNLPGNYQNPFNCNQYIMCSSDASVYIWECLGRGIYNPFVDLCVYRPSAPEKGCPWWSATWHMPEVRCETFGQREFWAYLTLPENPNERCGQHVNYCKFFETLGVGKCPDGFGFSKAYLACLPLDLCNEADDFFHLP